jgi:hypothetical protein
MTQRSVMAVVLTITLVILFGITHSFAAPVVGVVDPGSNWANTLNGTATYTFTNLFSNNPVLNSPMVSLQLGFSGDVFNLNNTWINSDSITPGWKVLTLGNGAYELDLLYGGSTPAGQSLSFTAAYSLTGNALNGTNPWNQYFSVIYAGLPLIGGGQVSIRTPEGSSLMFLASGLILLFLWRRRQQVSVTA